MRVGVNPSSSAPGREEFGRIMRCVALAQAGHSLEDKDVLQRTAGLKLRLPRLEGVDTSALQRTDARIAPISDDECKRYASQYATQQNVQVKALTERVSQLAAALEAERTRMDDFIKAPGSPTGNAVQLAPQRTCESCAIL